MERSPMTLAPPKAVIFDWDNTLVDTWPVIHAALHKTFTAMGKEPWTLGEVRERVKKSMRDSFPELFGDGAEKAGKLYQEHYLSRHLQDLSSLPQAEEVLAFIKAKGIYQAIVSNKKGGSLRKEAVHLGWDKYFDKIIGSDDAAHDKPDPAPVLLALEGSGIAPSADVWFVGDSSIDLECAQNTGCRPVLYGDVETLLDESFGGSYQGFRFEHHAKGHDSLLDLLRRVWG